MADREGVDVTDRTCTVPGCDKPWLARKMCRSHYNRLGRPRKPCSIEGCSRPVQARELCAGHYKRWQLGDARLNEPFTIEAKQECATCGTVFDNPTLRHRYCSPHCKRMSISSRRAADPTVKKCKTCLMVKPVNEFWPLHPMCQECEEIKATGNKRCQQCKKVKPLTEFSKSGNGEHKSRCKPCAARHVYETRNGTPEGRRRNRDQTLMRKYRLTPEAYQSLLDTQGGVCAICARPPELGKDLHVDHDHSCCPLGESCGGCVRGLLCPSCNKAIGLLQDSADVVESALKYLVRGR